MELQGLVERNELTPVFARELDLRRRTLMHAAAEHCLEHGRGKNEDHRMDRHLSVVDDDLRV